MSDRRHQAGPPQWDHRKAAMSVVYGTLVMLGAAAFIVLLFTSGNPY